MVCCLCHCCITLPASKMAMPLMLIAPLPIISAFSRATLAASADAVDYAHTSSFSPPRFDFPHCLSPPSIFAAAFHAHTGQDADMRYAVFSNAAMPPLPLRRCCYLPLMIITIAVCFRCRFSLSGLMMFSPCAALLTRAITAHI